MATAVKSETSACEWFLSASHPCIFLQRTPLTSHTADEIAHLLILQAPTSSIFTQLLGSRCAPVQRLGVVLLLLKRLVAITNDLLVLAKVVVAGCAVAVEDGKWVCCDGFGVVANRLFVCALVVSNVSFRFQLLGKLLAALEEVSVGEGCQFPC